MQKQKLVRTYEWGGGVEVNSSGFRTPDKDSPERNVQPLVRFPFDPCEINHPRIDITTKIKKVNLNQITLDNFLLLYQPLSHTILF